MIKEIIANLRGEVDNIVFRMDSSYFNKETAEVIEGAGYRYVVKAKEYTNLLEKAYDKPVIIWEDYVYQK